MRIEVGNFFWSRGIEDLPFNCTPQWLPIGEHWSLLRLCALAVQLASDVCSYNRAREIVNWSKLRPCGEYEQWEREGTAEIAGIQRWFADMARGKVCNFAFLTSSGGKFYEFFVTFALVIHPLTVKNRPCALIRSCALNRKNTVSYTYTSIRETVDYQQGEHYSRHSAATYLRVKYRRPFLKAAVSDFSLLIKVHLRPPCQPAAKERKKTIIKTSDYPNHHIWSLTDLFGQ